MSVGKVARLLCAALALASCRAEPASNLSAPPQAAVAPSGLDLVPVTIHSGQRTHRFNVEVARTPDQQAQGLMYRDSLPDDGGMLFPFPFARPASFWMLNTYIPLDMLFIREDGTIARIAANTVPRSQESMTSGEPVIAVLELNGGKTGELGISEGDRVSWPR